MEQKSSASPARLLKDPLGHFLMGGLAIFLLITTLNPASDQADNRLHIVIDRDVLLTELQFKAKIFEPALAEEQLASLPPEALEQLIDQYVREEVLFREASHLGFGDNDYIIKKRMIQKMDFIIQGVSDASSTVDEGEIQAFYDENYGNYIEPGFVTFTHVFIDADQRTPEEVETLAAETLQQLVADDAGFTDAPGYGDRFPFGVNYVEKPRDVISSHFGPEMAEAVHALDPQTGVWQGPIQSHYGMHLVMLTKQTDDRQPPLEEIRDQITADVLAQKRQQERQEAISRLVERYTVERQYVPPQLSSEDSTAAGSGNLADPQTQTAPSTTQSVAEG